LEAAADIDMLVLDKTGTFTFEDRRAVSLKPVPGVTDLPTLIR
jgi:potassium-transporting ATPase ATP-binding subunit